MRPWAAALYRLRLSMTGGGVSRAWAAPCLTLISQSGLCWWDAAPLTDVCLQLHDTISAGMSSISSITSISNISSISTGRYHVSEIKIYSGLFHFLWLQEWAKEPGDHSRHLNVFRGMKAYMCLGKFGLEASFDILVRCFEANGSANQPY